jgi:AraC-like DNA-binding protein
MEHSNAITEAERLMSENHMVNDTEVNYLDEDIIIMDNIKLLVDMRPNKPNMNVIAICKKGKVQMNLNENLVEIKENDTLICPPNMIFSNVMVSTDFEYTAIAITNNALQSYLRSYMPIWNNTVYINKLYVIHMDDNDMEFYKKFYDLTSLCLNPNEAKTNGWYQYRSEILKGLITAGLIGLCNKLNQETAKINSNAPKLQSVSIFNKFLQLLQNNTIKHQPVDYYATELCITAKYLTVICKKNSGKTAYDWIQEYTLADITYSLNHTNLSIKEICNKTGFPNSSFFGKYVKEHLGCTPGEYRHRNKGERENI